MNYNSVLIKDKADITDELRESLSGVHILGAYEKPNIENPDEIRVLSVKFSKVGKKTLDTYKNLEWIVCRSHGIDNVNEREVRSRNIGVISTNPTAKQCAKWIYDKLEDEQVLIFGNGSISKELQKYIKDFHVVDTTTTEYEIQQHLATCSYIVVALPLTEQTHHYFDEELFKFIKHKVRIVSISRGEVFDNNELLKFVESGKLEFGAFDMLSADRRDELLKHSNVKYYEHTSWKYGDEEFSSEYVMNLKQAIDDCLSNEINNANIKRQDRHWF